MQDEALHRTKPSTSLGHQYSTKQLHGAKTSTQVAPAAPEAWCNADTHQCSTKQVPRKPQTLQSRYPDYPVFQDPCHSYILPTQLTFGVLFQMQMRHAHPSQVTCWPCEAIFSRSCKETTLHNLEKKAGLQDDSSCRVQGAKGV